MASSVAWICRCFSPLDTLYIQVVCKIKACEILNGYDILAHPMLRTMRSGLVHPALGNEPVVVTSLILDLVLGARMTI